MTDAEALFLAANDCLARGELDGAARALRQALALAPAFPEACANLALVLERQGEDADAEAWYRRALDLDDDLADTHINFGVFLAARKRFEEARRHYRHALAVDPTAAAAWCNLGVLHASLQEDAEAERCYRMALLLEPEYGKPLFNLSYLLLRQGRLAAGWEAYEARPWQPWLPPDIACPRWAGEALAGKRLLVCCEGGYGDMIQFSRYAALLAPDAGRVGLLAYPALARLLRSLRGVEVFDDQAVAAAHGWDYWIPAMSLPRLAGTTLANIPAVLPYLHADAAALAAWRGRLPPPGDLRVGVVWQGNPRFENDADRSLAGPQAFAALAALPGVRLVSLQVGAAGVQTGDLPLHRLTPEPVDFADTAAIVAQLDLVISIDSAVAHLAGALGIPCWVLLPWYKADWRWLTGRSDSPWYPGVMRLFRQPRMGDWGSVLQEVRTALAARAAQR